MTKEFERFAAIGRHVLKNEAEAIMALSNNLDNEAFIAALKLLKNSKGKVVVSGIGKSGIVARKLAATLSSTGTFCVFVHPVEALHGDLGMITHEDVVIVYSHSGESTEMIAFVNSLSHLNIKIIAITGNNKSSIAKKADVALETGVKEEACTICTTFNLAPTTSVIAALALSDAIANTLHEIKGFQKRHFAKIHPGGSLGKKVSEK
ncbi:MAG: SIS domain-containing protein [Patescibacteria group bacterium]|jgi:arabinose-5-phosphate isomerase